MGKPSSEQLDPSDAVFVDIMHTSANSQDHGVVGPVGHREEVIKIICLVLDLYTPYNMFLVNLLSIFM